MSGSRAGRRARPAVGMIDAAARLPSAQGWILLGWTPIRWAEREPAERLYANLLIGTVTGEAVTTFFERDEAPAGTIGFCTVLEGPSPPQATLGGVQHPALQLDLTLLAREPLPALTVAAMARRLIRRSATPGGDAVLACLPRPGFDGQDTVGTLWPPVHLELDQALQVGADGVALIGWFIDVGGSVATLSVCGPKRCSVLDPQAWLPLARADIAQQLGRKYGLETDAIGFLAYAPDVADARYIEIETDAGEIACKPLRVLHRPRLGVIKQLLSIPRPPAFRMQDAFATVLGPIVEGLNGELVARPLRRWADRSFGALPASPRVSVVITLHGRVDFMELQLALFCERPDPAAELIYVLDDPDLADETERLAFSCWARFKQPFRLLMLAENVGFAAANNAGLAAARARHVCLLNSDVFPRGADGLSWLDPLVGHLEADPELGAVAPLLLFEDGTVQHAGMHYERRPSLADWAFPIHTCKGFPPEAGRAGLETVRAVTGACMVMRRADILAGGGLDAGYAIGDFEDADLCERLQEAGLRCAVDHRVALYHLERQSQGSGQPWRANATLFNAWRFNGRWGDQLDA